MRDSGALAPEPARSDLEARHPDECSAGMPDAAGCDPAQLADLGRGADVGPTGESDPGDGLEVRTEESSGARSGTRRRSALTSPAGPGPTSSAIDGLCEEVEGDSAIVDRFVLDYLGLLEQRLSSVSALLGTADATDALRVRILSLETTSAMIGAGEVVTAAQTLRLSVLRGETDCYLEVYAQLEAAVAALQATLGAQGFSVRPAV